MNFQAFIASLTPAFGAFGLAVLVTAAVRRFAIRFRVLDDPKASERKLHAAPMPLLGGFGVIIALIGAVLLDLVFEHEILKYGLPPSQLLWLLAATGVIALGGFLDDRLALPGKIQILFPIVATLIVIGGGIGIRTVTNPFGGVFHVELWQVVTFVWLLGMTYTTKLLDGVDGLATSITAVGAFMIAMLAFSTTYFQPDIARLAMLYLGALLGFLVWNFHPAKIYLGEAGSEFLGFFLGVLAIISGSKIATALLVMGIPALDVAVVMARRAIARRPIFSGDRSHLHFQLLQAGLGTRGTVLFLSGISLVFGATTLFLQSRQKLVALGALVVVTFAILFWVKKRSARVSSAV